MLPLRMSISIEVISAPHVRAHYHTLAYLELPGSAGCYNPGYVRQMAPHRPDSVAPPTRDFGRLHSRFRKADGADAVGYLPLPFRDEAVHSAVIQGLIDGAPPPPGLTPLAKRAIAPLADTAGARLVSMIEEVVGRERTGWLDAFYRRETRGMYRAQGLGSYLSERLGPLLEPVYGEIMPRLVVMPCEALMSRSFSIVASTGVHHLAAPVALKPAYFHALVALVKHRTDRLIRHYLPVEIKGQRDHPMHRQMRMDAAFTTVFQLLMRRRTADEEPFKEWATTQYAQTARQPRAAVEALHSMKLIPATAVEAMQRLVGDTLE